jgi:hypothetical protein
MVDVVVVRRGSLLTLAILVTWVLALAAGGCAESRARQAHLAHQARRDLVGLSRGSVVQCAGEPREAHTEGAREYMTYVGEKPPAASDPVNQTDSSICVATFVFRHDTVERLEYSTLAGRLVRQIENCYDIVDDCLTLVQ